MSAQGRDNVFVGLLSLLEGRTKSKRKGAWQDMTVYEILSTINSMLSLMIQAGILLIGLLVYIEKNDKK